MENLLTIIIGAVLALIGVSNCKGNINSLHSYHIKRVTEENRLPFGRLVGAGTIIVGVFLALSGVLGYTGATEKVQEVVLIAGFLAGLPFILYAMFKYNKGIF